MKEKKNYTLDPAMVRMIHFVSEDMSISESSALNYILHDYVRLNKRIGTNEELVEKFENKYYGE